MRFIDKLPYSVGMRSKKAFLSYILVALFIIFFVCNFIGSKAATSNNIDNVDDNFKQNGDTFLKDNDDDKLGLNKSVAEQTDKTAVYKRSFKISCVADQDLLSPFKGQFRSYRLNGRLDITQCLECDQLFKVNVIFYHKPLELLTGYGYKQRGAELSELIQYNGKLITCDDRTGIIFELTNDNNLIPYILLSDGNGANSNKGFKCEWMTIKNNELIIGSIGKEWTTKNGTIQNYDPTYVKVITKNGVVTHTEWRANYEKIRNAIGCAWPGYFVIEVVIYSYIRDSWIILPRRISKDLFNEKQERNAGSNLLIETDMNFNILQTIHIGRDNKRRGFSSAKFIPGTDDNILFGLRTEEITDDLMKTYYTVFNINGVVLVEERLLSDNIKYEGVEFVM